MKKIAAIVALVVFAVGIMAIQSDTSLDFNFDLENMLACDACTSGPPDNYRPEPKV